MDDVVEKKVNVRDGGDKDPVADHGRNQYLIGAKSGFDATSSVSGAVGDGVVSTRISMTVLVFYDICLAFLASLTSFYFAKGVSEANAHISLVTFTVLYCFVLALLSQVSGLQDSKTILKSWSLVIRCCLVACLSIVVVSLIAALFLYEQIGRYILLYAFLVSVVGLVAFRICLVSLLAGRNKRRVLFVGSKQFRAEMLRFVRLSSPSVFEVVPSVGSIPSTYSWVEKNDIDEVVVEDISKTCITKEEILMCINMGRRVHRISSFFEYNYLKVHLESLNALWILDSQSNPSHVLYFNFGKRIIDITVSCIGLIVCLPLMTIVALLIGIESRGGVVYSQVRVGQYGKAFTIYKFRTMKMDAEINGAQYALVNDDRVTRVGSILRRSRLDEIPQLFNVLIGDMSLVGPRPERPVFVEQLDAKIPFFTHRQTVKPGVTGWAQINYPYGSSVYDAKQKLSYDLYYVKYGNLLLDLQILLRTVGAMAVGSR